MVRLLFALILAIGVAMSSVGANAPPLVGPAGGGEAAVRATGSRVARLQSDRAADVVNVRDYCTAPCTSTAEQTAAFLAAVARVNALGGGTIFYPAGIWHYDTTAGGGPGVLSTYGASIRGDGVGSTTIVVTGGSWATWTLPADRPNGGHGGLRDLRLYENDNPASGTQVALDRVNGFEISSVWLGGGFVSLDLDSAVGVHGINVTIEGDNGTAGAAGMRLHRSSSSAVFNSENNFTNLNIRGANGRTLSRALVVGDADGLFVVGGHLGFTAQEAVLLQPEHADDVIDNVRLIGVDFDTAADGLRFAPYGGRFTGYIGGNAVIGGLAEITDRDGIRIEDPAASDMTITGVGTTLVRGIGINIQAGSNIAISGTQHSTGNAGSAGTPHILIGGTATGISLSGAVFRTGKPGSVAVPYNVEVSGSATNVGIGPNVYAGAAEGDVRNTSTGQDIAISPGSTDRATETWTKLVSMPNGVRWSAHAADPTAVDVPDGHCVDWKNTINSRLRHVCNDGGQLRSVTMK